MTEDKKGFWGTTFTRLKSALSLTKDQVQGEEALTSSSSSAQQTASLSQAAAPKTLTPRKVDHDYLEDLQDRLIKADLGLAVVDEIIEALNQEIKGKEWTNQDVEKFLQMEFSKLLSKRSPALNIEDGKLNIVMVVGVNGVGKTTSIGKLASRLKSDGKKVLLAAGDTFRAAAESQLEIWSKRADVDILRLQEGADPGAVVFQALKKAREENYDVVIIDTAGRLHNKANLMAELKKVRSVVEKQQAGANLDCLLVLDASTGQNGLQQAKVFSEVCGLTGVILTKLDGSSKGGVVFAISQELDLPVKLIGIGEQIDDLRDFDPEMFVRALF